MRVDVVTIFPEYFAPLDLSLIGRARAAGQLDLAVHDLRSWTHDVHRTVDDTPYGGGPGMVMRPEPWGEALDALLPDRRRALRRADARPACRSPRPWPHELAAEEHLVFACGRYEGIDQRVLDHAAARMPVTEVSLGRLRAVRRRGRGPRDHGGGRPGCCPACSATPTRWPRSRTPTACWRRRSTPSRPQWRGLDGAGGPALR